MGKMTSLLIENLYQSGKAVYEKRLFLDQATKDILTRFQGEIAESSASFYISLYGSLIEGQGSTWNQNSDLLLYYVRHITLDEGVPFGKKAYHAALKFAEAKTRKKLISELKDLAQELGLTDGIVPDHIDLPEDKGTSDKVENVKNDIKRKIGMSISETISSIKKYIENNGFSYDGSLIENFYLSLKSKPFVILAGTSGTGKTRLVKLFTEAIDAKYKLIPVRPDWSDSSDLLGYSDLNGHFHAGEMLKFVGEAIDNPDVPYILCLDEMNLARVEYYLSDILSVIETRDKKDGHIVTIPLLSEKRTDADTGIEYENPAFPENLYIVGTVNMDETTFPFSKKVLDRANTIEFNYVDLTPDFYEQDEAVEKLSLPNDFLKTEYLILQTDCQDDMDFVASVSQELQELNGILKKGNAHVGYRVRDEICFYMLNNKKAQLLSRDEAFDNEIMQKILPRLQGSSLSTKAVLCDLFKEIAGDYDGYGSSSGNVAGAMDDKVKNGPVRYPRSAEKIAFMVRRFEEDGFTSYWL